MHFQEVDLIVDIAQTSLTPESFSSVPSCVADVLWNTPEKVWRWMGMDESRRWERIGL